mmetsp:Transcript_21938/g.54680  ORF Transcript_21938/g.54680 Transcript_21938/m.54680 type:complete len:194 (+) Transcript_21938:269-850(+)
MHTFDNFIWTAKQTPWKMDPPPWQGNLRDRLSASIINSRLRTLFNPSEGGLVISPSYNSFLCAWAVDAGTMSRTCNPPGPSAFCIPGCSGHEGWCEDNRNSNYCPWRPNHIREMVEQQLATPGAADRYNEVIIDAAVWERNMPLSVEGVYYTNDDRTARAVHRKLAEHFPDENIPLLRVDLFRSRDPFSVVNT